jgi:hypothetical protein
MQEDDDALKAKIRDIQRTHGYAIGFKNEAGQLDARPPGPDDPVPDLPGLPPRAGLSPLLIQLFSTAGMKRRVEGKAVPLAEIVKISEAAREHSVPIGEAFAPIVNAQTAENMREHADPAEPWGRPTAPAAPPPWNEGDSTSYIVIDDPINPAHDSPEHRAKVRALWAEARRRAKVRALWAEARRRARKGSHRR